MASDLLTHITAGSILLLGCLVETLTVATATAILRRSNTTHQTEV